MTQLERRLVDSLSCEGIKGVGDRSDPSFDGDGFAFELARIAAAIPPFMMGPGDGGGDLQNFSVRATENAIPNFCMLRDHIEFFLGKLAKLEQHMIKSADFPDIVHQA